MCLREGKMKREGNIKRDVSTGDDRRNLSLKTEEDDHEGHMECCVQFSMGHMNKHLRTQKEQE